MTRRVEGLDPMPSPARIRELYRQRTGRVLPLDLTPAVAAMREAGMQATARAFTREAERIGCEPWPRLPISEHDHQVELFAWAARETHRWPELALLFAIPNFHGRLGRLTAKQGAYLRDEGRKPGVPDMLLPVARGVFHGLFIELKRIGGKPNDAQLEWRAQLRAQHYRAEIVEGWHAARDLLIRYLDS